MPVPLSRLAKEVEATGGVGGLDFIGFGGDGDLCEEFADGEGDGEIALIGDHAFEAGAAGAGEAGGFDFDVVSGGVEMPEGVIAVLVGNGLRELVWWSAGGRGLWRWGWRRRRGGFRAGRVRCRLMQGRGWSSRKENRRFGELRGRISPVYRIGRSYGCR